MKQYKKINKITLEYEKPKTDELQTIERSSQAMNLLRNNIDTRSINLKMSCYVLLLSAEDKLLGFSEISSNQSMDFEVNYRELLQVALATNVPKIIIAYNRVDENYDITPQEIKNITELKEYLLKVNITLKDYLLFTSDGFADVQSDHL